MGAELRGYRSHPKMKISDHKPVSSVFDCDVRVVDTKREKDVLEEITRKLDKLENDTLPQVDLSATEFVFENVKFQVREDNGYLQYINGSRDVSVCVCVSVGAPVQDTGGHQYWNAASASVLHSQT